MSTLCCPGTGFFPAYSGLAGVYRNNPQTIDKVKKGALPVGKYYIVSRPNGGWGSAVRDRLASWGSGSDRDLWFALFKDVGLLMMLLLFIRYSEEVFAFILPATRELAKAVLHYPHRVISQYYVTRYSVMKPVISPRY